jgi:RNA polymerase sigma-70 factor (ECF subfamily)
VTTSHGPEIELTDVILVRRIIERDESALATLYDRYARLVYSVALRVLKDPGAAEEVVQDIFHQVWRNAATFDSARGSLSGWLLVSARNRSIDRLRRRRTNEDELQPDRIACSVNIETSAAQNELLSKVKQSMGALPENQRAALELAYFEGLTHSEIASKPDCAWRLNRLRKGFVRERSSTIRRGI